jgi:subtilisin family serine protease
MNGLRRTVLGPGTWRGFVVAMGVLSGQGAEQVFEFRDPGGPVAYQVELPAARALAGAGPEWLSARRAEGSARRLEVGHRIVLEVVPTQSWQALVMGHGLRFSEAIGPDTYVFEAADAASGVRAAAALAGQAGVVRSHPVRRQEVRLHGGFAPRPDDVLWPQQWHLENRDTDSASRLGYDLNVRAAWAWTRGAGVVVAQADDGLETDHPDLRQNAAGAPHYDFFKNQATGLPPNSRSIHGTAVAGLIAAEAGSGRGVCGVAPAAGLASWVVFSGSGNFLDDLQAARMFAYASNVVAVQNHSWGNADREVLEPFPEEARGITRAIELGRGGKGVVMVRAAGNERLELNNANDDGYANDIRVITVGAVRNNGQVTSYSTPGACVLVAAFSADKRAQTPAGTTTNYPSLATTDRRGSLGYNTGILGGDGDYAWGTSGFDGTSGSTPQITGLCALLLAVNPELTYRDVQQVLIHSARQLDGADPGVHPNGAGFLVSDNTGFGVPDAGDAVALARQWPNRPSVETATAARRMSVAIPDDGLRVTISGALLPPALASIPAYPVDGLAVDEPTELRTLVDVDLALDPIRQDVRGKAVLIRHGTTPVARKLANAAAAGAEFALVYHYSGTTDRVFLNGADVHLSPIPAVFIGRQSGEALRDYLTWMPGVRARVQLERVRQTLTVGASLLCEHVTLRVQTSHGRRGDLRITLVSPAGTRSVLQHFNQDLRSSLDDWTYSSVHHFYESSAGDWQVEISDQRPGVTGSLQALDLVVHGVPLTDLDRDGLDDDWEREHFGDLGAGPRQDPDGDGWNNAREQILETDPRRNETPLRVELMTWDEGFWRLAWPARPGTHYRAVAAPSAEGPYGWLGTVPADGREAAWIVPRNAESNRFFRVEAVD